MTLDELLKRIGEIVEQKLIPQQITPLVQPTGYISRKEVCTLLKISLPTLNEWSKLDWLKAYKLGNRVLYKEIEVKSALETNRLLKHRKSVITEVQ